MHDRVRINIAACFYCSGLFERPRALFVKLVFSNVLKYGYLYR
jgi:hypothetical protein